MDVKQSAWWKGAFIRQGDRVQYLFSFLWPTTGNIVSWRFWHKLACISRLRLPRLAVGIVLLTYIQAATIEMGRAERKVSTRHPYRGITIIASRYSNIPPNDQNSSMTMTIVARDDDGRYSSINVDLVKPMSFHRYSLKSASNPMSLTPVRHPTERSRLVCELEVSNSSWARTQLAFRRKYSVLHWRE